MSSTTKFGSEVGHAGLATGTPRPYTVSIALPGSILANVQTRELQTYVVGQVARAAAIFCVDEIVVFNDGLSHLHDGGQRRKPKFTGRRDDSRGGSGGGTIGLAPAEHHDHSDGAAGADSSASGEAGGDELTGGSESPGTALCGFMARLLQYVETP